MSEPGQPAPTDQASPAVSLLSAVGLFYLGLGVLVGIVWLSGSIETSLFPTGWLFPAILVATGALMTLRRRFDIVATLWGGLALAVFMLDVSIHVRALDLRFNDPAAFDATVIVAAFGLVALMFRPQFRT